MGSYKQVISRITILKTHIAGAMTPLITTHEPLSRVVGFRAQDTATFWDHAPRRLRGPMGFWVWAFWAA